MYQENTPRHPGNRRYQNKHHVNMCITKQHTKTTHRYIQPHAPQKSQNRALGDKTRTKTSTLIFFLCFFSFHFPYEKSFRFLLVNNCFHKSIWGACFPQARGCTTVCRFLGLEASRGSRETRHLSVLRHSLKIFTHSDRLVAISRCWSLISDRLVNISHRLVALSRRLVAFGPS